MPVPNPDLPTRTLLNAGFRLTSQSIERLKQIGVHSLWIRYPGLDFLDEYVNPRLTETKQLIGHQLTDAFAEIQVQANAKLPIESYCRSIGELVNTLLDNPTCLMFLNDGQPERSSLLDHSINVAYISLLLGLKLDWYLIKERSRLTPQLAKETTSLGLGAMLHDVGMLLLDESVRERYFKTRDQDDPEWRRHTRLGYDRVRGSIDPSAAVIVLHHHQHYDGTGFPTRPTGDGDRVAGMRGDAIHIFCRIVAIADTFDSLLHPIKKPSVPAVAVIGRMLSSPVIDWFDPEVMRAFLAVVPPYPPGTLLRLSDGRCAVAIDHSLKDPCRPTVQIIPDPEVFEPRGAYHREDAPHEVIDLQEQIHLSIKTADGQDVSAFAFLPPGLTNNNPYAHRDHDPDRESVLIGRYASSVDDDF